MTELLCVHCGCTEEVCRSRRQLHQFTPPHRPVLDEASGEKFDPEALPPAGGWRCAVGRDMPGGAIGYAQVPLEEQPMTNPAVVDTTTIHNKEFRTYRRKSDPHDCFHSPEFRAFALRWLGFDPGDPNGSTRGNRWIEIRIALDEPVSYTMNNLGYEGELMEVKVDQPDATHPIYRHGEMATIDKVFEMGGWKVMERVCHNWGDPGKGKYMVSLYPFNQVVVDGKQNPIFHVDFDPSVAGQEEDARRSALETFKAHHGLHGQ